ncbi:MAG: PilC/PilY family type IV pilus protein [Betaproteobacteria bacterium]
MNFYTSLKHRARKALTIAGLLAGLGAQAQAVWDVADTPLLGGDNLVAPNLIFMFDDSGSMTSWLGSQYPYCMDAYNLVGRFYPSTDPNKGFLWRLCSLYGDNLKTPFDFNKSNAVDLRNYADPSRLAGPYRDLRTLATYSYTFNPLYYNPNVRYVPWPGLPNADPKAARPLATDPPVLSNGTIKPAATSTFNLVNNAPLKQEYIDKGPDSTLTIFYIDENGTRVNFPSEFPNSADWQTFNSNNVTPSFLNSRSNNQPPPGYDRTTYNPAWGGGRHDAFADSYNADYTISTIGPFFIAQYVQFTGDPWSDTDVVDMNKYVTVKIDQPATAIPLGNTSYPPDPAVKSANRTDCVTLANKCTLAEEQTNFANWFSYYKTKRGLAIGTVAQAFANLPGNFRVGWGTLSKGSSSVDGQSSKYIAQGVRRWDQTVTLNGKTQTTSRHFMDWIANIGTAGDTTLREELEAVGTYFKRTDNAGPWGNSPGDATDQTAQLSCRRNYHLAVTDGGWTKYALATNRGNVDGTNQGGNYIATKPYSDAWFNTLADISMYYWANDLRPDMADTVNGTATDPANWQHLTNYYLMFNLSKTIDGDSATDMQALTNGTKIWPDPTSATATESQKIDDTLHAALNSRGKLFHVTGPESVVNAISSIQRDMSNSRGGSDAQVQVSGQYLTQTSKKFKPSYTTIPWGGDLGAINLNADGSEGTLAWSATDRLRVNLPADRKIFTMSGSTARAFTKNDLPSVNAGVTQTSADLQNLANYVRGDRSLEGQGYRYRGSALGDIINSSPLLVGSGLDSQYDLSTGAGYSSYRSFLTAKKARPERVYVGANDGMLHAFNANTGDEDFAYIPSSQLGKFFNFASPTYSHRYFVDGQITELDAYDTTAAKWRNLVVTSTGAGAKTVFAINVPTGANAAAPGATDVLWEISDTPSSSFSELGYTLSKFEAGLMRNGQYAVLINNGYASASGQASLFIVNALTGALIKKIDTGAGANTIANKNGLGGVRVIRNAAREIVAAYAGDLKGNMWKFDLSDTNSSNWNLAFTPQVAKKPLFKASLPITAAPGLIAHPLKGLMVIFGTGKMFESSDPGATDRGYIYSVWDKDPVGTNALASSNNLADSSTLVAQTLTSTDVQQPDGSKKTFYTSSNNSVDYATKRGWYAQLAATERVIYDPQAALGRIYVESVSRHVAAADGAITCNPSSFDLNGYLLDPFTGSYNAARPTLDTNGDGVLNASDTAAVVGYKTPTISRASVTQSKMAGTKGVLVSATDQKAFNGNQALVRRAWRHIVTPP